MFADPPLTRDQLRSLSRDNVGDVSETVAVFGGEWRRFAPGIREYLSHGRHDPRSGTGEEVELERRAVLTRCARRLVGGRGLLLRSRIDPDVVRTTIFSPPPLRMAVPRCEPDLRESVSSGKSERIAESKSSGPETKSSTSALQSAGSERVTSPPELRIVIPPRISVEVTAMRTSPPAVTAFTLPPTFGAMMSPPAVLASRLPPTLWMRMSPPAVSATAEPVTESIRMSPAAVEARRSPGDGPDDDVAPVGPELAARADAADPDLAGVRHDLDLGR